MTTDWGLLEPWCAAICASVVRDEPMGSTSEMVVSFKVIFEVREYHVLSLLIHLEEEISQNVFRLIQIREAIELVTVLSRVDNEAFRRRFPHIKCQNDGRWCPRWTLHVCGSATVQQATWNSLFAFSDTSPQFQRAIEKLNAMELEDSSISNCIYIGWACKFSGADVNIGAIKNFGNNEVFNGIKTGLKSLFKVGISLVPQLYLAGDAATLADLWRDHITVPMGVTFSITIRDFTTTYSQVLAGLAWLPIRCLQIIFNTKKATIIVGAKLRFDRECPAICSHFVMECDKMASDMFPAIDSIQATRPDTSILICVDSVDSESWPLVMDAICCEPCVGISLIIDNVLMANSDLLKIADVVVPWRRQSRIGNGIYGASEERNLQVSSAFRKLHLCFTDIESGALVINLLGLIGRNLRSLTLSVAGNVEMTLDLSELSVVCVNLEALEVNGIHVVVSVHTEALSLWPIRELRLDSHLKLSDLTLCLRNPNLRMTRELRSITIGKTHGQEVNEEQKKELLMHDGDFLSIRKKKAPTRSKAAMISIVNSALRTKAIRRLHEDVLGLIFAFASTPATRSVFFW